MQPQYPDFSVSQPAASQLFQPHAPVPRIWESVLGKMEPAEVPWQFSAGEIIAATITERISVLADIRFAGAEIDQFFHWHDVIGSQLAELGGFASAHLTRSIVTDFVDSELSAVRLARVAEQFGESSQVTVQGRLLLSSYREFSGWLLGAEEGLLFSASRQFLPLLEAGTDYATDALWAASTTLSGSTSAPQAIEVIATVHPNAFDVLRLEVRRRYGNPRFANPRTVRQSLAQTYVVRNTPAALRFVEAWVGLNDALALHSHGQVFVPSTTSVMCSAAIQAHLAFDENGFAGYVDWLYKLVEDGRVGNSNDEVVKNVIRAVADCQAVQTIQLLRNRFMHAPRSNCEEARQGKRAGECFIDLCTVPDPRSPRDWQRAQITLLDQLTACLVGIRRTIPRG